MLVYANLPPRGEKLAAVPESPDLVGDAPQPIARTVESALPGGKPTKLPPSSSRPAESAPAATTPAEQTPTTSVPMPMPMPTPSNEPTTPPAPVPETTPLPDPKPDPVTEPMSEPEPKPEPAPEPVPMPPIPAPAKPADLAALGKALTLGKAAITEQNFDEADKYLAEAASLATTDEHRQLVARLREVAGYVRQFRQAVIAAANEFEAGEAFKVGTSTLVAVVEATPDKIIIRHTGQNKVYPYAELPPGLAVAIADFKLDSADPVSRVVKGAYYAVANGDQRALHEKAKTWWEEAQLGGVDLAHLMPFLTDQYDLTKSAGNEEAQPADRPSDSKVKPKTKTKDSSSKQGTGLGGAANAGLEQ
jgi:outer membrane biosynthesis protein TonB